MKTRKQGVHVSSRIKPEFQARDASLDDFPPLAGAYVLTKSHKLAGDVMSSRQGIQLAQSILSGFTSTANAQLTPILALGLTALGRKASRNSRLPKGPHAFPHDANDYNLSLHKLLVKSQMTSLILSRGREPNTRGSVGQELTRIYYTPCRCHIVAVCFPASHNICDYYGL